MDEPSPAPSTLAGVGIWSSELRYGEPAEVADLAAELETLGYSALWIPDTGGEVFAALDVLLTATNKVTVATGILNIWMHEADATVAWWNGLGHAEQQRTLLGLGVSHAMLIGDAWVKPLARMRTYLDELDSSGLPPKARCLAALGPKMLHLAADRSAGAHPYFVTPEHTALAREAMGADALLAPEQGVILDTDPDRARTLGREALSIYALMPNYSNNWKRLGFTDVDVDTLSDALVDRLIAWGDVETIGARIQEHRDAGADHVAIQVINAPEDPAPRPVWRELACLTKA